MTLLSLRVTNIEKLVRVYFFIRTKGDFMATNLDLVRIERLKFVGKFVIIQELLNAFAFLQVKQHYTYYFFIKSNIWTLDCLLNGVKFCTFSHVLSHFDSPVSRRFYAFLLTVVYLSNFGLVSMGKYISF